MYIRRVLAIVGNFIFYLLIVIFIFSMFTSISSRLNKDKIPSILGFCPMTVLTGSMSPHINPGDIIIDKKIKAENVNIGDVITFRVNEDMLVTHRVVEIVNEGGRVSFRTKGDANDSGDSMIVLEDKIEGKYLFKVPYAGYVARFIRSAQGFLLIIIMPSIILISNQIKLIFLELRKEKTTKDSIEDS